MTVIMPVPPTGTLAGKAIDGDASVACAPESASPLAAWAPCTGWPGIADAAATTTAATTATATAAEPVRGRATLAFPNVAPPDSALLSIGGSPNPHAGTKWDSGPHDSEGIAARRASLRLLWTGLGSPIRISRRKCAPGVRIEECQRAAAQIVQVIRMHLMTGPTCLLA